jgi:hypothetical protein
MHHHQKHILINLKRQLTNEIIHTSNNKIQRAKLYFERSRVNSKLNLHQYVYNDYLRSIELNPLNTSMYLHMMNTFLYKFNNPHWANLVYNQLNENCREEEEKLEQVKKEMKTFRYAIDEAMEKENSGDVLMYYPFVTNENDTSVSHNETFYNELNKEGIQIRDIERFGSKGVFSTKKFEKDEVIFEEEPFVSISLHENRCIRCNQIILPGQQISNFCKQRYDQMKSKRLCGETLSDLREYFAQTETDLPKLALLFARFIGKQVEENEEVQSDNIYTSFPLLKMLTPSTVFSANTNDPSKNVSVDLVPLIHLYKLITERLEFTDQDYAQNHFQIFENLVLTWINYNFSLQNRHYYFIGKTLSFVNHNCMANARLQILPAIDKIKVIAIRPIEQNEELTISYFDPNRVEEDTSFMYGFVCGKTCACKL